MRLALSFRKALAPARRGSILICVLVCLAVTTALVTSTVRTALDARRTMRTQHRLRQTELLLAAGIQRAALRLKASDEYEGETWELPGEVLPGVESARVIIDMPPTDQESAREIRVTAKLSLSKETVIQRSSTFQVDSPKDSS